MPFTIFCHLNSPEDAYAFLADRNATIKGDADKWSATCVLPGKFWQRKKRITFNYDREWCSPPNWPRQIMGMGNFVGEFQMEDAIRGEVMKLISQFRFSIGIVSKPEIADSNDPRLFVMHSLAEQMGGCLFTPGALLDSSFRAFAAADGDTTPRAVMPELREEDTPEDDGEDDELEPPSAERVARRMYVMAALAARGLLDMNLGMGNTPSYGLADLHEWMGALDIAEEAEAEEQQILQTAERGLAQQDCLNSIWSLEALAVLAWALGLAELPPYDQLVETDDLLQALSFLDVPSCKQKLASARLRPAGELACYHEQIFAHDWRMVDYRVNRKPVEYASVQICGRTFDLSWAKLVDGDLALQGERIDAASGDLVGAMCSLAVERHKASNWLQGYARLYSRISADT